MEDSYEELAITKEASQIETIHGQKNIGDIEESYEELAIHREANQMETIHGPYKESEIQEEIDQERKTHKNIVTKLHGINITLEESACNIEIRKDTLEENVDQAKVDQSTSDQIEDLVKLRIKKLDNRLMQIEEHKK